MAAPAQRIEHGTIPVDPIGIRLTRSLKDLDHGYLDYKRADFGSFTAGGSIAEFPNLRIQDIDERSADDGNVDVTLEVAGLISGSSKRIALQWHEDPFGFDTADESRIELVSAAFTWAAALSGYSNMLLTGPVGEDQMLDDRWCRRSLNYRGIKKAGLTSRRVTVNENIVTPSDPVDVDLTNPTMSETGIRVQASFPRIVVIETVKSTSAPDTEAIPGAITTPISGVAFPAVRVLTITGDVTLNWPYGWKLASIDPEYLHAGSSINVCTYTYEYVHESQF